VADARHHHASREIVFVTIPEAGSPKDARRLPPPAYKRTQHERWKPQRFIPAKQRQAERIVEIMRDLDERAEAARQMLRPDAAMPSPLQRAARTCALAGFGDAAKVDPDLLEWNYGDYEGRKTSEILAHRPGGLLFRDGCPNGEQPSEVGARADRVIGRLRAADDQAIVFSSGHILRLAARWLGLAPSEGRLFMLGTASVSILGHEHDKDEPAVALWNSM
jgi:broad specificity phosphatase PhoE